MYLKRKGIFICSIIILILIQYSLINLYSFETKKKIEINSDNRFVLGLGVYERPQKYYNDKGDYHFYYDEQPIKFEVEIIGNPSKEIKFENKDWYNMINLSIASERYIYYENDGKIRKAYFWDDKGKKVHILNPLSTSLREGQWKINYKVIEGDDLENGILKPGERKRAIIEVFDENNEPFKPGYKYEFHIELFSEEGVKGGWSDSYIILKPITQDEKKELLRRKGDVAAKTGDYVLAIEKYKQVLKIEKETEQNVSYIRILRLLNKISTFYENKSDYDNAKNTLIEAFELVNNRIEKDRERYNTLSKNQKKSISNKGKVLSFDKFVEERLKQTSFLDHRDFGDSFVSFSFEKNKILTKIKKLDNLIKQQEEGATRSTE